MEMDRFCFSRRALLVDGGVWTDVICLVDAFLSTFAAHYGLGTHKEFMDCFWLLLVPIDLE